ncbi:integrase [Solemya velum gill symbiont]|uniref:Integrase n=1 Tax=Solemya velum gill symbiont TaxID=2340 RepID=A0A0B0H5Y6_SOVGS|nr:integrase arm-type DNA-binding domain-containing protein [Solemya velum gill symbiont]KHF24520.1 integrase [Solemya velum gill symbiont]
MAKTIKRLTDIKIKRLSEPGAYPDGEGLYLQVVRNGSKSWFYRYETGGKGRKKGLGSYPTVSLENARKSAQKCRELRQQGFDPIDHTKLRIKEEHAQKQIDKARVKTFRQCAEEYIESRKPEWSNAKHANQWRNTLSSYAFPHFGDVPVADVDVTLVLEALRPIWQTKTETATRVRQRIEAILDYATALHYRDTENPARWKSRLDKILPKPTKIKKVSHHNAMPYTEVSEYFRTLKQKETIAAHALAFIILTATRSGEARGARWDEIDLEQAIWTIPAERMKARREFRVPLSVQVIEILNQMKPLEREGWVFPGLSGHKGISEASLRNLLKSTHPDVTTHGFRSTFRDWCAEMTSYPREIAETALAHVIKNKAEAAYQRGDLLERRRRLMEAWEGHLLATSNNADVIPILKEG